MKTCQECQGTGTITIEMYHRQGFNRDIGYIEERTEVCTECQGTGEIEEDENGNNN